MKIPQCEATGSRRFRGSTKRAAGFRVMVIVSFHTMIIDGSIAFAETAETSRPIGLSDLCLMHALLDRGQFIFIGVDARKNDICYLIRICWLQGRRSRHWRCRVSTKHAGLSSKPTCANAFGAPRVAYRRHGLKHSAVVIADSIDALTNAIIMYSDLRADYPILHYRSITDPR